jgi:hypothetical protein
MFSTLPVEKCHQLSARSNKYLNDGDRISFDVGEARGKPLAIHIQIIEEAAASSTGGIR